MWRGSSYAVIRMGLNRFYLSLRFLELLLSVIVLAIPSVVAVRRPAAFGVRPSLRGQGLLGRWLRWSRGSRRSSLSPLSRICVTLMAGWQDREPGAVVPPDVLQRVF